MPDEPVPDDAAGLRAANARLLAVVEAKDEQVAMLTAAPEAALERERRLELQLLGLSGAVQQELVAATAEAETVARNAEADAASESGKISLRWETHKRAEAKPNTERSQHQQTLVSTARDLAALPAQVGQRDVLVRQEVTGGLLGLV